MESTLNRILQVHYLEIFDEESNLSKSNTNWIDEIVNTLEMGLSANLSK